MKSKIFSKWYIFLSFIIPFVLAVGSLILIRVDQPQSFCWTKFCLENFISVFNIPIRLFGMMFVTTGFALTYYKIDLNYNQNERQVKQHIQTNYNIFKSEFLTLLNEREYKLLKIEIPSSSLFNSLYPEAKKGNFKLCNLFEEFLTSEQGFIDTMNTISKVITSPGGSRYKSHSFTPIFILYQILKEIINFDARVNFGFNSGALFTADYSNTIIDTIKDIFAICTVVNEFEDWVFFDNKQRRIWRARIDGLITIQQESHQLEDYIKNGSITRFIIDFARNDEKAFETFNLLNELPENLRNNDHVKQYIFESLTTGIHKTLLTEAASIILAKSLNIKSNILYCQKENY